MQVNCTALCIMPFFTVKQWLHGLDCIVLHGNVVRRHWNSTTGSVVGQLANFSTTWRTNCWMFGCHSCSFIIQRPSSGSNCTCLSSMLDQEPFDRVTIAELRTVFDWRPSRRLPVRHFVAFRSSRGRPIDQLFRFPLTSKAEPRRCASASAVRHWHRCRPGGTEQPPDDMLPVGLIVLIVLATLCAALGAIYAYIYFTRINPRSHRCYGCGSSGIGSGSSSGGGVDGGGRRKYVEASVNDDEPGTNVPSTSTHVFLFRKTWVAFPLMTVRLNLNGWYIDVRFRIVYMQRRSVSFGSRASVLIASHVNEASIL